MIAVAIDGPAGAGKAPQPTDLGKTAAQRQRTLLILEASLCFKALPRKPLIFFGAFG